MRQLRLYPDEPRCPECNAILSYCKCNKMDCKISDFCPKPKVKSTYYD